MIALFCETAKKGLAHCYLEPSKRLPHTTRHHKENLLKPAGDSVRYAAISQIGIQRWLKYHHQDRDGLPDLWSHITDRLDTTTHIGDLALALWAGVQGQADNCEQFVRAIREQWPRQSDLCNAVELGWVVQACTVGLRELSLPESDLKPILDDAHTRLASLFNQKSNLFQRHNRGGFREIVSRQVACFADQVYPIVAMSTYGTAFGDRKSIDLAGRVVEQICRHQGTLGQWQWHYDVFEGKVCEEYPVFSVHQDSMAPMSILAGDNACGADHTREIDLGMRWLFGENELQESLVLEDKGIIWRDIERREPAMFSRKTRSMCCILGLKRLHRGASKFFRTFVVNRECRPYHLGWILYAWADYGVKD